MDANLKRKLICALDTGDLTEARGHVRRLKDYVGAFKIGHALTLPHGLEVVEELQEVGAERIFLDLKFHDIPSVVALGVREAAKRGVWMLTMHMSGGPAMMRAAVEEAASHGHAKRPNLMGVSVLTSLDEQHLQEGLGVGRTLEEHMSELSRQGCAEGLDGVVCSAHEITVLREVVGRGILVVPGIRPPSDATDDQRRVGTAEGALNDGADYLVIGRALTAKPEPYSALRQLGFDV